CAARPVRNLTLVSGTVAQSAKESSRMQHAELGSFGRVSRLTLGGGGLGLVWGEATEGEAIAEPTSGGGLGLVWGESTEDEAIATLHAAVDAGIDLIDTAPMYGACEAIVGKAFGGRLPAGVRVATQWQLSEAARGSVACA